MRSRTIDAAVPVRHAPPPDFTGRLPAPPAASASDAAERLGLAVAGARGGAQLRCSRAPAASMVRATHAGSGTDVPPGQRERDVRVLDLAPDTASVRVVSTRLVDHLHLARRDGQWKIVNVLRHFRPEQRPEPR